MKVSVDWMNADQRGHDLYRWTTPIDRKIVAERIFFVWNSQSFKK
jgi:hypothetical protein